MYSLSLSIPHCVPFHPARCARATFVLAALLAAACTTSSGADCEPPKETVCELALVIPITMPTLTLQDRVFEIEVAVAEETTLFTCDLDAARDQVTCTSSDKDPDPAFDVQLDVDVPGPAPAQMTLRIDRRDEELAGPNVVTISVSDDYGQFWTTRATPSRRMIATDRGNCTECVFEAVNPIAVQ
ncbi:MAG: hypothetical protein JKY37_08685 [Nannocystaceae bacterium]|nr:hypothetical protein [Nannocystaceae bacterium]